MNFTDIKYKANYYVLLMMAFVIPLERKLIAPLIILFFVTCLFNFEFKPKKKATILLFSIIYIIYIIGLLYSDDLKTGFFDITTKLSLIIFPISFFIAKLDFNGILNNTLKSFIEGCFVSVVIALISSSINFYFSFDTSLFFYGGAALFMHSSYFAMLLSLCLVVLYYFLLTKNPTFKQKTILFLIILFSTNILLLSSKTGLITMLLVHSIAISIWVIKYKAFVKGTVVLLLLIISFFVTYQYSSLFKQRVNELATVSRINQSEISSTSTRKFIWITSFYLIKNNPIIGYGTGDAKNVLVTEYQKEGMEFFHDEKLNAHNQFFQTTLAIGLIGGVILILMLIIPIIIALKNNYIIYLGFLIIISINFLTEAMLERQVGVVFYAFFNSLFFVSYYSKYSMKNDKQV